MSYALLLIIKIYQGGFMVSEKDTIEAIMNRLLRKKDDVREELNAQIKDLDEQLKSLERVKYTICGEPDSQETAKDRLEKVVATRTRTPVTENFHRFIRETGKKQFKPRDVWEFEKKIGYDRPNGYMSTYMNIQKLEKKGEIRKVADGEYILVVESEEPSGTEVAQQESVGGI